MWFIDSTGKLRRALVDTSGHIQADILTSPLSALIGEVQAAPTTYTVLDRLKTLATLLNAGLPAALDTGALKVREQNPLASINVGNWPADYPDAGVAKLLGGGLPSALTSDKLKVRASEIETLLGAGLPSLLDTGALKTREQNPLTEIDVDIAKILNSAVSLTNYLPVGIAYPAGTLIDPRSIRALTTNDEVTIKQPATKETFKLVDEKKGFKYPDGSTDRSIVSQTSIPNAAWTSIGSFTPANTKVVYLCNLSVGTYGATGFMLQILFGGALKYTTASTYSVHNNYSIPFTLCTGDGATLLDIQIYQTSGGAVTFYATTQIFEV